MIISYAIILLQFLHDYVVLQVEICSSYVYSILKDKLCWLSDIDVRSGTLPNFRGLWTYFVSRESLHGNTFFLHQKTNPGIIKYGRRMVVLIFACITSMGGTSTFPRPPKYVLSFYSLFLLLLSRSDDHFNNVKHNHIIFVIKKMNFCGYVCCCD